MNDCERFTKGQWSPKNLAPTRFGMKYPQLVSAQAVNAISDWLVSRLERLGIDAPLVYSRLLLSLLHTPLQLNALDLADVSPKQVLLKGCVGRVGGQRLSTAETKALKRFAAIESLVDAAASDEQKSDIENLVDDLCEKLHEIEKQTNLESELSFKNPYTTTSNATITTTTATTTSSSSSSSSSLNASTKSDKSKWLTATILPFEDPTNRYYRAFPPLSKDFGGNGGGTGDKVDQNMLNTSQAALSWPKDSGNNSKKENYGKSNSSNSADDNSSNNNNSNSNSGFATGVKRKSRRRRNNFNNKGAVKNFNRKFSTKLEEGGGSQQDTPWDTNFEGQWEMGHDRIRDYIMKQNKQNRRVYEMKNKSGFNSGGGASASTAATAANIIVDTDDKNAAPNSLNDEKIYVDAETAASDTMIPFYEPSPSMGDKTNVNNYLTEPRRLYERDVSQESVATMYNNNDDNLALFKAKFNRSVEALWDNHDSYPSSGYFVQSPAENSYELNTICSNLVKQNVLSPYQQQQKHLQQLRQQDKHHLLQQQNFESIQSNFDWDSFQNNKKNDFIQAGTNLSSSIWSFNNNKVDVKRKDESFFWPQTNNNQSIGMSIGAVWDDAGFGNNCIASEESTELYPSIEKRYIANEPTHNLNKWSEGSNESPFHQAHAGGNMYKNNSESMMLHNNYMPATETQQNCMKNNLDRDDHHHDPDETGGVEFNNHLVNNKLNDNSVIKKIILFSHSETSEFTKFQPKLTNQYGYYDQQYKNGLDLNKKRYFKECEMHEDENLLISAHTHFRPIRQTYVDGYEFDIPCKMNDVKFKRSESGFLYFNSEKYMEYQVQKVNGGGGGGFNSRCGDDNNNGVRPPPTPIYNTNSFTLKFCVKQNEKYCQTEANTIVPVPKFIGNDMNSMYRDTTIIDDFDMNYQEDEDVEEETNNSFGVLKNFMCNEQNNYNLMDDYNNGLLMIQQYKQQQPSTCIIGSDIIPGNLISFYENYDWPTTTNHHQHAAAVSNKFTGNSNNHVHSLWGHCPTCNDNYKSIPANDIMKAELSIEGDKIMSDLMYMQNLFIGTDWDDEQEEDEETFEQICIDKDDFIINSNQITSNININNNANKSHAFCEVDDDDLIQNRNFIECDVEEVEAENDVDDDDGNSTYCNVNKLISDLLKPETAKSLTEVLGPSQGNTILHGIALNEMAHKYRDFTSTSKIFLNSTATTTNSSNNNNNSVNPSLPAAATTTTTTITNQSIQPLNSDNNFLVSVVDDEVFELWKKADGDWGNCKNIKKIIANLNEKDDKMEHTKLENFKLIHLNNNNQNTCNRNQLLWPSSFTTESTLPSSSSSPPPSQPPPLNNHLNECNELEKFTKNDLIMINFERKTPDVDGFDSVDVGGSHHHNHHHYHHNNKMNNHNKCVSNNFTTTKLNLNNSQQLLMMKPSRIDRKRRHSSSQNFRDDIFPNVKLLLNTNKQYDLTATVVACKYWARDLNLEPKYDENEVPIKTSSSLLQHIAMVSRPLTR